MKVLAVDDHQNIIDAIGLCINLRWPAATVLAAGDGAAALRMAEDESPDVIVLDIGLPDRDGFDILQQVRQFSQVPIIMLTVRDDEMDIVRALQMGADDYITKPFSHLEFLARVEAVLRRTGGRVGAEEVPLVAGDLWVDFGSAQVRMKGQPVLLSPMELRLLSHLMHNAGRVVSHQAMIGAIWGVDSADRVETQSVKVHILNLRRKLGDDAGNPSYIGTVYSVGYRFLKQVTAGTGNVAREPNRSAGGADTRSSPP